MNETFTVRIADAAGQHLESLSNFGSDEGAALDYVMNVGQPSACRLTVPRFIPREIFRLDGQIAIWRSSGQHGPFQEGNAVYLIRKFETTRTSRILTGYHANSLFDRRYVCYDKSTTFADKSTPTATTDLIKTIWKENNDSSINASARDGAETQADISTYVQVQANSGQGALVTVQAGRRNVGEVIRDLSELSFTAGTYVAAEIVGQPNTKLELRTTRGRDRRWTSDRPLLFSEAIGTLADARLIEDYSDEKTVVIAVGAGDDDLRLVQVAIDTTRITASPLNRIEHVVEYSNIDDDVQLLDAAEAELQLHRPQIYLTASIPEGSSLIRGEDYDLGDLITAEYDDIRYDCRLDSIRVYVGYSSRTTQIVLRSITP